MRRPAQRCATPLAGSSLDDRAAVELESVLAAIADRHRLKILNMLVRADAAPICVCEFTAALELAQPNVSYHLRQLIEAGIITRERRGRYSYYSLVPGALSHIAALVTEPTGTAAAA
jgi:ArsR family transcriptional regulator, arsenate/arsenite/antimonite-responsive transcriptional repressor